MILVSFIGFLSLFALVGIYSYTRSRGTTKDYYVASQSVAPWLTGLSAVATNNSGYMFIGVIGYTYATGLASVWLMVGWIVGDLVAALTIQKKFREASGRTNAESYAALLSRWQGSHLFTLQKIMALLALVFLTAYASAQLVAGSKALSVILEWPTFAGALLGASLVFAYCMAGGIRASIWTDAAQSFVMVIAMGVLLVSALIALGGVGAAVTQLEQIPEYLDWMPPDLFFPGVAGLLLFILGWFVAGFSVAGQPHIMVRFMAIESTKGLFRARVWYYTWFVLFYCMATSVGLLARILLPESTFDAELALPLLAQQHLPSAMVGLVLAGIFAATISTADSLILSCSSILSTDFRAAKSSQPGKLSSAKLATGVVILVALGWALLNKQSVFNLVVMSWSALGSAFVPLLILLVARQPITQILGTVVVLTGFGVSLLWRALGYQSAIYEGVPAIFAALVAYYLVRIFQSNTQHNN